MELAIWTLEQVNNHLTKYSGELIHNVKYDSHDDELWVGWIIGKFLKSRKNIECFLGLPFKEKSELVTLDNLAKVNLIEEYTNIDIAIIQKDAITNGRIIDGSKIYRIQIKRYKRQNPSTSDCIIFMKEKLDHYAPDKNLNFAFLIETGFKIDISKIKEFVVNYRFNFASLWFIGYYLNKKLDPFLMPIFPKFTGEIWKPSR